jgi:hypothetical protein
MSATREKSLKLQNQLKNITEEILQNRKPSKLILISIFLTNILSMLGPFYMFDMPQIFEDVIIRNFNKNSVQVESLYSIYSIPNFVMTPLGTYFVGLLGLGLATVLFESLIVGGSIMIFYGFSTVSFSWVFWGRAIYGLGSEVEVILGATIADKWFSGKLLSISQSMARTLGFLGVFLALQIGPNLFLKYRVISYTMFAYVIVTFFSFIMAVTYCLIEHNFEAKVAKSEAILKVKKKKIVKELEAIEGKGFVNKMIKTVQKLLEGASDSGMGSTIILEADQENEADEEKDAPFQVRDIKKFSALFWVTAIGFAIGSNLYLQFVAFSTDCLVQRFGYTFDDAKSTISALPIFAIFFGPVISTVVTKTG